MAKGKYEYWLTDDGLLLLAAWARDGLTDEQIANNIILFDNNQSTPSETTCISTLCSNISGIYDCEFKSIGTTKKKTHETFLVKMQGDSMSDASIKDGDILLVDGSSQAVNNSIIVAEINNCICIKKIKFLNNNFVLFSENKKYPPITITNKDNFMV